MKGLPQNVLLNFRLEFPKSDLTIYLPSGISEIFRQMVSTLGDPSRDFGNLNQLHDQTWRNGKLYLFFSRSIVDVDPDSVF